MCIVSLICGVTRVLIPCSDSSMTGLSRAPICESKLKPIVDAHLSFDMAKPIYASRKEGKGGFADQDFCG